MSFVFWMFTIDFDLENSLGKIQEVQALVSWYLIIHFVSLLIPSKLEPSKFFLFTLLEKFNNYTILVNEWLK